MKLLPAVSLVGVIVAASLPGTVADADVAKVSHVTTIGVHDTYETSAYDYLARSLDAGTSLIELDVWPDTITREWKVSHSNPLGNNNNCVAASSPSQLYSGGKNKNLEHCLDDIRVWLSAHPGSTLKLEMKTGFADNRGLGSRRGKVREGLLEGPRVPQGGLHGPHRETCRAIKPSGRASR